MAGKTPVKPKTERDSLAKLRAHVGNVERRLKAADKNTKRSVKALETAFDALKGKVGGKAQTDLRAHVDELAAHLNRRLDESRAQVSGALQDALQGTDIDQISGALSRATARLSQAELRQAESIQKVNEQIIRLATAIDNRVRTETREREALEHRVNEKFDAQRSLTDTKLSQIEEDSAAAIRKIGNQIAQLSADLTEARAAIEHRTEGRIYEAALDSQHEIENLKADIDKRLAGAGQAQPYVDITPMERSVAALSARLDSLEARGIAAADIVPAADLSAPPFPAAQPEAAPALSAQEPPLPLPVTPAVQTDSGAPLEFDPSRYETVSYAEPSPPAPAPQNPYAAAPAAYAEPQAPALPQVQPQDSGHAAAQMALHDYDAPADFDPYAGSAPQPDIMPAAPAYADNPYQQNPYAAGLPNAQPGDPYAAPPLSLDTDMSMAAARPGADAAGGGKRLPKLSSFSGSKLTPRTLRTAASAAALVAVVAAGAWIVKDRLPGGEPRVAQAPAANPASRVPAEQAPKAMPVSIMPSTGAMSPAKGAEDINPSKPRIDNYASLDAAVAAGNPVAQLQKGLTRLQSGDEEAAATFIRAAANQGLPAAQYYLGNMYENGQGVAQDAPQARLLTERAARAGHRIAMYDLALYYIEGKGGVDVDLSVAAQWFEKAAQFGMTDAQYNLAVLYERGTGVPTDPAEAYNWCAIAGGQGDQDAARRAGQLELELPSDVLARAKSKVASYRPSEFDPEVNGIFQNMPWNSKPKRGNSNVATVQKLLLDLGYDAGVADGAMGPRTAQAIKAFERANGLPETGRVDDVIIQTLKDVAGT